MSRDEPDRIVAARLAWPPLVVGKGTSEMYIASFLPAFLDRTRHVQHVEEAEIVDLRPDGARFWPIAGGPPIEREVEEADASI